MFLLTFSYENLVSDQDKHFYLISLSILITYLLDKVGIDIIGRT